MLSKPKPPLGVMHCLHTVHADCISHVAVQEEQVEYLDDSEVDFSSDEDDDEEEDMEDFAGQGGGRPPTGRPGKRPAGAQALQTPVAITAIHPLLCHNSSSPLLMSRNHTAMTAVDLSPLIMLAHFQNRYCHHRC